MQNTHGFREPHINNEVIGSVKAIRVLKYIRSVDQLLTDLQWTTADYCDNISNNIWMLLTRASMRVVIRHHITGFSTVSKPRDLSIILSDHF